MLRKAKSDKRPLDKSMLRRAPKAGGMTFFLWNTRPEEIYRQWTSYPTKAAALTAAQAMIDKAGASGWLWIEERQTIHTTPEGLAQAEWGLTLFESLPDALDAIADLDGPEYLQHHAALLAVEAGKEPSPMAAQRKRRGPKSKPKKSVT